ncbi:MAG: LPS biosynthesis protein WbpP, partial [Phycisphaerales bacterium]|nr:LPS biosynthesis protein WbpP [Phycisphaerales bacterium]
ATTTKKLSGEVVNIACGERTSLNAMLAKMQIMLGTKITPEHLPPRPGDVRDSLADITAARKLLGYKPEVLFEEGLQQTVAY